jgi:hypothetical protein
MGVTPLALVFVLVCDGSSKQQTKRHRWHSPHSLGDRLDHGLSGTSIDRRRGKYYAVPRSFAPTKLFSFVFDRPRFLDYIVTPSGLPIAALAIQLSHS